MINALWQLCFWADVHIRRVKATNKVNNKHK